MKSVRTAVGFVVLFVVAAGLLFGSAGTLAWPMAWAYLVLSLAGTAGTRVLVGRRHPDLLLERARGLRVEGTRAWDRWLVPWVVFGPVIVLGVAGLDHRWQASHLGTPAAHLAGVIVAAFGYVIAGWAMAENRFFSATARIQTERGHRVVETGPYRLIRHPGYAGSLLATLAVPVILDSAWALVPAVLTGLALVVRTALEDGMLRRDLDGYAAFASRTRFRLVPGVW